MCMIHKPKSRFRVSKTGTSVSMLASVSAADTACGCEQCDRHRYKLAPVVCSANTCPGQGDGPSCKISHRRLALQEDTKRHSHEAAASTSIPERHDITPRKRKRAPLLLRHDDGSCTRACSKACSIPLQIAKSNNSSYDSLSMGLQWVQLLAISEGASSPE